jgi:L-aspartate oxidase
LEGAASRLAGVRADAHLAADVVADPQAAEWETTNVHQVATAIVHAAWVRTETRGGHFRTDFPEPDPAWERRVELALAEDGTLAEVYLGVRRSRARIGAEWVSPPTGR